MVGEGDALLGGQALEQDRHGERADLRVRERAVGDPADEEAELVVGQLAAVALAPDQLGDVHQAAPLTKRVISGARSAAARAASRSVCS